jgi:putative transposase
MLPSMKMRGNLRVCPLFFLGRRYVQYVNRSYRRTGTLWDSRYKSSLIQAETYLLACQRYVELNPVRAAMVEDPAHYRWSSYRANALGQADALLTVHPVYLALGRGPKERQGAYRALFRAHLERAAVDDTRLALNQNQPLGNARFYARIERLTGVRREARPRGSPTRDAPHRARASSEDKRVFQALSAVGWNRGR